MQSLKKMQEILSDNNISWTDSNKNVGHGNIGICCKFCGDKNYHCGIFERAGKIHYLCWRCGKRGTGESLLREYLFVSTMEARRLLRSRTERTAVDIIRKIFARKTKEEIVSPAMPIIGLPHLSRKLKWANFRVLPELWRQTLVFLDKRNISLETAKRYDTRLCVSSDCYGRLVFPIRKDKKIVGYQSRAIHDDVLPKYKAPKDFRLHDYLYNYDNLRRNEVIIVVEGILDVWRLYPDWNLCASFGAKLTLQQKDLILALKPTVIMICYDGEAQAYQNAVKEARFFEPLVHAVAVRLPAGRDPDTLGKKKFSQLMKGRI